MSALPQLRQAAGDERIWGNLGSLESCNENLGTVIRGVRQIGHPASPQYIWRANMEHLGRSSLVQEIRHIYALMCKIHQVSLARSNPKGQTGTVVAHLISATSTQIGTPGIHTGPIRSIISTRYTLRTPVRLRLSCNQDWTSQESTVCQVGIYSRVQLCQLGTPGPTSFGERTHRGKHKHTPVVQ